MRIPVEHVAQTNPWDPVARLMVAAFSVESESLGDTAPGWIIADVTHPEHARAEAVPAVVALVALVALVAVSAADAWSACAHISA